MTQRLLACLLLMCACGDPAEPDGGPVGDTSSPAPGLCDEAPAVTWNSFGQGFVLQHCDACHRSTVTDRQGAPASVSFDSEEDVWQWADRILVRAASDEADMPPQGGVEADDRYLLEVWLSCGG